MRHAACSELGEEGVSRWVNGFLELVSLHLNAVRFEQRTDSPARILSASCNKRYPTEAVPHFSIMFIFFSRHGMEVGKQAAEMD